MRVTFSIVDPAVPSSEAEFLAPSQTFLTKMKEYEVHGVSVYRGVTFLHLIDDLNTPTFFPRAHFNVVNSDIPGDWICNIFPDGPVQVLLGPPFMAKDLESYDGVVDQRRAQMVPFWNRIVAMDKKEDGEPED